MTAIRAAGSGETIPVPECPASNPCLHCFTNGYQAGGQNQFDRQRAAAKVVASRNLPLFCAVTDIAFLTSEEGFATWSTSARRILNRIANDALDAEGR